MKKVINIVLLLVLGLVIFPTVASADVKKINGVTYSRTNINYALNNEDYLYMYGVISPGEFIICNDDSYAYHYFKNGAYREEDATLSELMETYKKKYNNNSIYIEYSYNDNYEISKKDHTEAIDSEGQCYRYNTDIEAKDGVTYYTLEDFDDIIAHPVLDFNEEDVFHYYVRTECMDTSTDDKLTEAQITILNDLYDSIEEENEEIYANKYNMDLRYFPFLVGNKYINVFETRYTNDDSEVFYDPYEYEYDYKFYDFDGNEIEELKDYIYIAYLSKSNLLVATNKSTISVFDTDFNLIFTADNPYSGFYLGYSYFIFEVDSNRILLDFSEGEAAMITRYVVLDGKNQTYDGKDLVIKFNGEVSLLDKVYIDDTELSTDNFAISEGSTIITLKDAYLKTLANATYTLKATYKDGGVASTTFVVNNAAPNPDTNDTIINSLVIGSISLLAIGCLSLVINKKRLVKAHK